MAESAKPTAAPESFVVPDPDNVPVTFVNQVSAIGQLNGVVNVLLTVARFSPNAGGGVDNDLIAASRLRMDMVCAGQLHAQLGRLLQQAESLGVSMASAIVASTAAPGKSGKSN